MSKDRYSYVAVFSYEEDGISIEFPDLPGCLRCAEKDNTEEALKNAKAVYKDEVAKLDENKNIIADESCQTNIEGVFVAGDVRSKKVRQLTTAVSDGTVAAILAEEYINKNR